MTTTRMAAGIVLAGLVLAGCGSAPQRREDPGTAKKPLTPDERWRNAQEKEATGDRVQSFAQIQYLQEAILEYQALADHHPRDRRANQARDKVKKIRGRVDVLREWKTRWDAFESEARAKKGRPAALAEARRGAAAFVGAPMRFVRDGAAKLLAQLETAARNTADAAVKALEDKVSPAVKTRDWAGAFAAFGSFDPDLGRAFPEVGEAVEALRADVERRARDEAAALLAQAEEKTAADGPLAGVRILVRGRGRFAGLPVEAELRARERSLRAGARAKIVEARTIESTVPPPEPEPEPEPEPAEPRPAPAGTQEAEAKAAMAHKPKEEVPSPEDLFADATDRLAEADRWYYKAVDLEDDVLPGEEGYQENLKRVVALYEGVDRLYTWLLEKNKKPDDALEERMEKVQQALFWCRKNLALDD